MMNDFNILNKNKCNIESELKLHHEYMKSKNPHADSCTYNLNNKTMKLNIFDIAKYILKKTGEISTMKLQKLCYYAQAWSLVWDGAPLFNEDFQAWTNGPVCPELFSVHRGKFMISEDDIKDIFCSGKSLSYEQEESIKVVLDTYGNKSPAWLRELSHIEEPWKNARKGCPDGQRCTNIISKDSMGLYYGKEE